MNQPIAQETREPTLCQVCLNFFSRVPKPEPERAFGEEPPRLLSPWDLPESSRSCCSCWTILATLLRLYASAVKVEGETVPSLKDKCRELFLDGPLYARWYTPSDLAGHKFWTYILILPTQRHGLDLCKTHLEVWSKHSSPASAIGKISTLEPLPSSLGSEDSLNQVEDSFTYCVEHHTKFRQSLIRGPINEAVEPLLPTRVLDTAPFAEDVTRSSVKLFEANGARGHYAALSYCWGPPPVRTLRTISSNLQHHLSGFDECELPLLFQDVVKVVRKLGIRYVWIDSLCIVQDDPKDWARESACMGTVYESARLTIAATSAKSPTDSLFASVRDSNIYQTQVPYIAPTREQGGHYFISTPRFSDRLSCCSDSILGQRGWVVQEWALSRRIIHFHEQGLIWRCKTLAMAERNLLVYEQIFDDWKDIIQHFTKAELTYRKDRLVALRGLESVFSTAFKKHYIYGLCVDDFPLQLFWTSNRGINTELCDIRHIPSWSWARRIGVISFFTYKESSVVVIRGVIHYDEQLLSLNLHTRVATVASCGERQFPKKDRVMNWFYVKALSPNTGYSLFSGLGGSESSVLGCAFFDGNEVRTGLLECVFLIRYRRPDIYVPTSEYRYYVLLVERVGDGSQVRRVGAAIIMSDEIYASAVPQDVCIV